MSARFPDPAAADLGRIPLFRGLKRSEVERIGAAARFASFPASTVLTILGQPGDVVYVILAGTVRVDMPSRKVDSGLLLALLGPGEIMGELSVVDGFGRSATSITLEPTQLLWVDGETFVRLLEELPRLAYNLAESLAHRLRLSNEQRQVRVALDVRGRVAFQLLALARDFGERADDGIRLSIRLTQADLARLTGASRVRVNQVLSELRGLGWIALDAAHGVTIRDAAELQRLCDGVFAT